MTVNYHASHALTSLDRRPAKVLAVELKQVLLRPSPAGDRVGVMLAVAMSPLTPTRILAGEHAHAPASSVFSLKLLYFSPAINRAIYFD